MFIGVFSASTVIGIVTAFMCTTVLATGFFRVPEGPAEAGFVIMAALASYFAAQVRRLLIHDSELSVCLF
jgi:hypothetical protein